MSVDTFVICQIRYEKRGNLVERLVHLKRFSVSMSVMMRVTLIGFVDILISQFLAFPLVCKASRLLIENRFI